MELNNFSKKFVLFNINHTKKGERLKDLLFDCFIQKRLQ